MAQVPRSTTPVRSRKSFCEEIGTFLFEIPDGSESVRHRDGPHAGCLTGLNIADRVSDVKAPGWIHLEFLADEKQALGRGFSARVSFSLPKMTLKKEERPTRSRAPTTTGESEAEKELPIG